MTQKKTLQGVIITITCIALGIVANAAGIDYDTGATQEIVTGIVANLTSVVGTCYGLYRTWKGRAENKKTGF